MTSPDVSIALLGDISLNGCWADSARRPFDSGLVDYVRRHDVVLLNLESPVRGTQGENWLKTPRLATSAGAVHALADLRPSVCVLGNNHFFDQLEDGLQRTIDAVASIGAVPVGAAPDAEVARRPAYITRGGVTLAILSYVGAETHPSLPDRARGFCNHLDVSRIEADVASERAAGRFVVVSLHWGQSLYRYPSPQQREIARRLSRAGAGIVWGHHAHVPQGWETADGTPIFYSMGNSVFDDCEGNVWSVESRRSLVVSLRVRQGKVLLDDIVVRQVRQCHSTTSAQWDAEQDWLTPRCRVLARPGYGASYAAYKATVGARRAANYFVGPGRHPARQLAKLPGRLLHSIGFR